MLLVVDENAQEGYLRWQRQDQALLRRINALLAVACSEVRVTQPASFALT